jgi:hypothetical protein
MAFLQYAAMPRAMPGDSAGVDALRGLSVHLPAGLRAMHPLFLLYAISIDGKKISIRALDE